MTRVLLLGTVATLCTVSMRIVERAPELSAALTMGAVVAFIVFLSCVIADVVG